MLSALKRCGNILITKSYRLSIYEVRLRDLLQIRKRMKKEDWLPVWTHCRHVKERGGTPNVYFQGRLVPWIKVWKEIRRNVPEHIRSATQGRSHSRARYATLYLGISALLTMGCHSAACSAVTP